MKYLFNKLTALLIMLMCVSAVAQAEIVHHDVCAPKFNSRGFTQECWEDTQTGKIFSDIACTHELVDEALAKAVVYKKLPENPICNTSHFSQSLYEKDWDVSLNWAAVAEIYSYNPVSDVYFAEFIVKGDDVANARLVWNKNQGAIEQGKFTIKIYVNNIEKMCVNQTQPLEGVFVQSLPGLKKGDVVKFEVTLRETALWTSANVGEGVFAESPKLEKVIFGDGMSIIGSQMFYLCRSLKNVVIPGSVMKVADKSFYECDMLDTVEIQDGVKELGKQAFAYCEKLVSVKLPDSITNICSSAFFSCSSLDSITLPKNLTVIERSSFNACGSLKSVVIQRGVEKIDEFAFGSCYALEEVTIPSTVKTIGSDAFYYCRSLRTVFVDIGDSDRIRNCMSSFYGVNVDNITFVEVGSDVVVPSDATGGVEIKVEGKWFGRYPSFTAVYGTDLASAVLKPNGKIDAQGNAMYVWQDYVAGTDPTDPNDVFRVESFNLVNGVPVIQVHPDLGGERVYKTFGSNDLSTWKDATGNEANFNFFKVTVEMTK